MFAKYEKRKCFSAQSSKPLTPDTTEILNRELFVVYHCQIQDIKKQISSAHCNYEEKWMHFETSKKTLQSAEQELRSNMSFGNPSRELQSLSTTVYLWNILRNQARLHNSQKARKAAADPPMTSILWLPRTTHAM